MNEWNGLSFLHIPFFPSWPLTRSKVKVLAMTSKTGDLKLIKTLWGIDDPISPTLFKSIKEEEGYHGVEVIRLAWLFDRDLLVRSLNESGLAVVCQLHTAGGYIDQDTSEYVYCGAYDVKSHEDDLQKQLEECKELLSLVEAGGFINIHAGVDAWSTKEAVEFLEVALKKIDDIVPNVQVTIETHRQRLFGNPFQTRDILSSMPATLLSKLNLNADLSHWYCACERVFNPDEERDAIWWPELISLLSERCRYIHARFGWAQGPQMADPSAKECDSERMLQLNVWKTLMQEQKKRNIDTFVCPEYGPQPYLPVMPHSQEPVASLPEAVSYTKRVIEDLFESIS